MTFREHQKQELLGIFETIMPHFNTEEVKENFKEMSIEELRDLAQQNLERIVCVKLLDVGIPPHMLGVRHPQYPE